MVRTKSQRDTMIENRWNQKGEGGDFKVVLLKTIGDCSLVQARDRGGWERGDPVVKQHVHQSKQNTAIAQYRGACQYVRVLSEGIVLAHYFVEIAMLTLQI
jgi:hypothetical protein